MPPTSHRLPRALLLSVGLHLGLGIWLWTRSAPEPPPAKPLQIPVTLQFTEVKVPLPRQEDPPRPDVGPTPPSLRVLVPRSTRRALTPLPEATASPVPGAARGGVHPYFHTLGRSILRHWEPEHYLAVRGFNGSFAWSTSAQKEVARVLSDSGKDRRALREKTREQLRTSRHATVRVIHDAQGKVLSVVVVSSSHDPSLDVLAADGATRAARRQPSLAVGGLGDREIWVSLWQMELRFSEHAPEPTTGLTFDEEMTLTELQLPPGLHLYKRVRLLEVR